MLDVDRTRPCIIPAGMLPYLTGPDPLLARSGGSRDPLGLQPVWSEFGRRLVPCIASPVQQVDGIKAVTLIHWLADMAPVRRLLGDPGAERGFFRLMEGLVEYWLHAHDRSVCFGSQSLVGEGERFAVTTGTGKTVANGLYQYYRGTCRRAGLLEHDWRACAGLRVRFEQCFDATALDALAAAVRGCVNGTPLLPGRILVNRAVDAALAAVFYDEAINDLLRAGLFGGEVYRDLARTFSEVRSHGNGVPFGTQLAVLEHAPLADELDRMRRCEPFLLVLQDVFDLARAASGQSVHKLASGLMEFLEAMRERAARFVTLANDMPTARMRQMQRLATAMCNAVAADGLADFVKALIEHHGICMAERGREPLVLIEAGVIVLLVAGERNPDDARARLETGYPWMNDYYLNTAANLYGQLHGESA